MCTHTNCQSVEDTQHTRRKAAGIRLRGGRRVAAPCHGARSTRAAVRRGIGATWCPGGRGGGKGLVLNDADPRGMAIEEEGLVCSCGQALVCYTLRRGGFSGRLVVRCALAGCPLFPAVDVDEDEDRYRHWYRAPPPPRTQPGWTGARRRLVVVPQWTRPKSTSGGGFLQGSPQVSQCRGPHIRYIS